MDEDLDRNLWELHLRCSVFGARAGLNDLQASEEEEIQSIQERSAAAKTRDRAGVPGLRWGVTSRTHARAHAHKAKQWSPDQTQTRPCLVLLNLL